MQYLLFWNLDFEVAPSTEEVNQQISLAMKHSKPFHICIVKQDNDEIEWVPVINGKTDRFFINMRLRG